MDEQQRIAELEAKVEHLTASLAQFVGRDRDRSTRVSPRKSNAELEQQVPTESRTSTRRGMLRLAGAATAGAVAAATIGAADQAAASSGDPLLLGESNSATSPDTTMMTGTLWVGAASDLFTEMDANASGVISALETTNETDLPRAAIYGVAGPFLFGPDDPTGHGVMGRIAASGSGSAVYAWSQATAAGVSAAALLKSQTGPAIRFQSTHAAAPTSGTWSLGDLVPDTDGNLWSCIEAGTPGTWRKVIGNGTAGAFHAITPGRVYDSRSANPSPGKLNVGSTRTVSIKDKRDTGNGAVIEANIVPDGATAIAANVTVTNSTLRGNLAVNPGGVLVASASTINWFMENAAIANGVTLKISTDRKVTVVAGGVAGGSTDFVIDVMGYWL